MTKTSELENEATELLESLNTKNTRIKELEQEKLKLTWELQKDLVRYNKVQIQIHTSE